MNGMSKGYLLHFAVINLPEVEDIPWGAGATHVDAQGDQATLGGQEEHLPHGQLLVVEVARQLHPLDQSDCILTKYSGQHFFLYYLVVQIFW